MESDLLVFGRFADDPKGRLANVFLELPEGAARDMCHDLAECFLLTDVERLESSQALIKNRNHYKYSCLPVNRDNIANLWGVFSRAQVSHRRVAKFQPCGKQTAPLTIYFLTPAPTHSTGT